MYTGLGTAKGDPVQAPANSRSYSSALPRPRSGNPNVPQSRRLGLDASPGVKQPQERPWEIRCAGRPIEYTSSTSPRTARAGARTCLKDSSSSTVSRSHRMLDEVAPGKRRPGGPWGSPAPGKGRSGCRAATLAAHPEVVLAPGARVGRPLSSSPSAAGRRHVLAAHPLETGPRCRCVYEKRAKVTATADRREAGVSIEKPQPAGRRAEPVYASRAPASPSGHHTVRDGRSGPSARSQTRPRA